MFREGSASGGRGRSRERIGAGLALLWVASHLPSVAYASANQEGGERSTPVAIRLDSKPLAQPEVTLTNLPEHERFWPYQIQLTRDWKPAGWEGDFGWGLGVLLTVDAQRGLRVDFGRFGKHWIPADATDVVERANRIRRGEEEKYGPNLVVALRNRLLDPSGKVLAKHPVDPAERPAIVLVHADPLEKDFRALAREVSAWAAASPDALIVLLAQGDVSDAHVYKACHEARWKGAFVLDRFGQAYSEGYLGPERARPHVQVLTREGRILLSEPFVKGLAPRIDEAVARAVAGGSDPGSESKQ